MALQGVRGGVVSIASEVHQMPTFMEAAKDRRDRILADWRQGKCNRNMTELARMHGVCVSRVSQILSAAGESPSLVDLTGQRLGHGIALQ